MRSLPAQEEQSNQPDEYEPPHSIQSSNSFDDTLDPVTSETDFYEDDYASTDDTGKSPYEDPLEEDLNQEPASSGVMPPPYQAQPPIEKLSEPLDHLYYDEEEPEDVPPPSPPPVAPQREFSDIHWKQPHRQNAVCSLDA